MKNKLAMWFLISCQGSAAPFAMAAQDVNQSLEQYCNAPNAEYRQTVTLGESRTVVLKTGQFYQLEKPSDYKATVEYISEGLVDLGLSSECAEYLMTKGKVASGAGDVYARVYFDFDKYVLTKNSRYVLNSVTQRLKEQPTDLIVEGHADAIGTHSYNFTLGLKRSQRVVDYLKQKGVDPKHLVAISKGEKQPIATNDTDSGRAKNRRVDLLDSE